MALTKKTRKGIVNISRHILDNASYKELSYYFKDIIVLKVELDEFIENHRYFCVSELFEEVKEGCVIPEYVISIELDEKGNLKNRTIERFTI